MILIKTHRGMQFKNPCHGSGFLLIRTSHFQNVQARSLRLSGFEIGWNDLDFKHDAIEYITIPLNVKVQKEMIPPFVDPHLEAIFEKVENEQRLAFDDGVALYQSSDLIGVGRLADRVRRRRHGNSAFYVVNQHLNYTNICLNQCRFCAFPARQMNPGGSPSPWRR